MDDLEFRRQIFAEPHSREQDLLDAKASDPAKQQLGRDLELLDEKIKLALNVPVPENLSEKLILRQTLQSHQQEKRKKRVHLALAASVALTFGLLLNQFLFTSAYSTLGEHAIAHVEHEYFSNDSDSFVTLAGLNNKMADFDGYFAANVGNVISAEFCWFDGIRSLHLVFQGETSPITVFIVPKTDELRFTSEFSNSTLKGKSQQFQQANVVVVGEKSEQVERFQKQVAQNIRWQA